MTASGNDMVTRVSEALLVAASPLEVYDDLAFRDTAMILARAAIKAMREPTGAMLFAVRNDADAGLVYRDMIDAAITNP